MDRPRRTIKAPERYSPREDVDDDFASSEYDSTEDNSSCDEVESLLSHNEDEETDTTPTLQGFIVVDDAGGSPHVSADSDWSPGSEACETNASTEDDTDTELVATEDFSNEASEDDDDEVMLCEQDGLDNGDDDLQLCPSTPDVCMRLNDA